MSVSGPGGRQTFHAGDGRNTRIWREARLPHPEVPRRRVVVPRPGRLRRQPGRPPAAERRGALDREPLVVDARRLGGRVRLGALAALSRLAPPPAHLAREGECEARDDTRRDARSRSAGDRPSGSVRVLGRVRDALYRGAGAGSDPSHHRRDRASVVLGGPLSRYARRHRERDPHPGADAGRRRRHDCRRHPQLLGASVEPEDRPDPGADEPRSARGRPPGALPRAVLRVLRPAARSHGGAGDRRAPGSVPGLAGRSDRAGPRSPRPRRRSRARASSRARRAPAATRSAGRRRAGRPAPT